MDVEQTSLEEIAALTAEKEKLRQRGDDALRYIRQKTDQLLLMMGTLPLRPEELDEQTLFALDPIGIIGESFTQILDHHRQTNANLALARDEIQVILDSAGAGIVVVDDQMRLQAFNKKSQEFFFPDETGVLGRDFHAVVCGPDIGAEECIIGRIFATNHAVEKADACIGGRHFHVIGTPIKNEQGEIVQVVLVYTDITERKLAEARIQQLAYYDALTELPNRVLLRDRLSQLLALAHRDQRQLAVLFLDLDRFKRVNDTLGHVCGDQLLKVVGRRLGECVRKSDTVARLGGDEFVIILSTIRSIQDVTTYARKVLEAVSQPVHLDGQEVFSSTSIGIAIYPTDGEDEGTLLKNADTAMYVAKERGRNTYQFFSEEMNSSAVQRMTLETHLRRALGRQEFLLHFQPQLDLASGRMTGMEALIRWDHPEWGLVGPASFIPLAEETGLIIPIGEWVLRTACSQAKTWQMAGHLSLRMAVNLSARQFNQPGLVAMVDRILRETGFDPDCLELELTESAVMENAFTAIRTLTELRARGVHLSIDDFGTGYSSLSCLKDFPINRIKIAQVFVRDIPESAGDAIITEAIIAMAHSLRLRVIAEGVETREQLEFLKARGCHEMQGYYFSRPLAVADFNDLLEHKPRQGDVCLFRGAGND